MGLFDIFRRKPKVERTDIPTPETALDPDILLLMSFRTKLESAGYVSRPHPQYRALIVEDRLDLAAMIIEEPGAHPMVMHVMVLLSDPEYFPQGIEEHLAGFGATIEEKISSAVANYVDSTLSTIADSYQNRREPSLDFRVPDVSGTLYHVTPGALQIQGRWAAAAGQTELFERLKHVMIPALNSERFHWLKIYISQQPDGLWDGDCLLDNEHLEGGIQLLKSWARNHSEPGVFLGLKQFVVLRACDADR